MVKKIALALCLVLLTFASLSAITAIKNGFITLRGGREIVALRLPVARVTPGVEVESGWRKKA